MKNILFILNHQDKTKLEIEYFLDEKFKEIIYLDVDDFIKNEYIYEKYIKNDFFIFFNDNKKNDFLYLEKIEEFLLSKELSPFNIIVYSKKKKLNLKFSKFSHIYELIEKPFDKNIFNAKLGKILKEYFNIKKIKDSLANLSIKTDYLLLTKESDMNIFILSQEKKLGKKILETFDENFQKKLVIFDEIYENFLDDYVDEFDLIILHGIDNIHNLIFMFNKIKAHEDLRNASIIYLINPSDNIFIHDVINLGINNYFLLNEKKNLENLEDLVLSELKKKSYINFLEDELYFALESSAIDETTRAFSKKYLINFLQTNSDNNLLKKNLGFIFFDIDNFKKINDEYGHIVGDILLKEISLILKNEFKNKIIARFGGDEFIVVITKANLLDTIYLEKKSTKIKKIIEEKEFLINSHKIINCSISSGFSIGNKDDDFNHILNIADQKLYKSKNDE